MLLLCSRATARVLPSGSAGSPWWTRTQGFRHTVRQRSISTRSNNSRQSFEDHARGKTGGDRKNGYWWWSSSRSSTRHYGYWKSVPGWIVVGGVPGLHLSSPAASPVPVLTSAPKPLSNTQILTVLLEPDSPSIGLISVIVRAVSATLNAIRISWRFLQLAVLFGPVIITFPIWYITERGAMKIGKTPRLWWVQYLVWVFEISGPTFTKLGQWASSRSDLFPPYVCEILGKLQSHVSPHSFKATKKIIRKEYGIDVEDMFEEFDEKPIGVGAIAQVYKAKLRPAAPVLSASSARHCAVKVLHPGVESLINADLTIMHAVASIIHLLPDAEWLSFPDEVEMFGKMMREQLDLRCEAGNLDRFAENFKNRPKVGFPLPFMPLVRKTVLIEEYQNALPIRKFLDNGHTVFDKELAQIGLDSFLRMLVIDNFVHADLHPGNIFVTFKCPRSKRTWLSFLNSQQADPGEPDDISPAEIARLAALPPSDWTHAMSDLCEQGYTPRLIFLDAGLVSTLSEENLRNFLDLFRAVAEFDGARVAHLMMERSRTPHTVIDPEGFVSTMREFLDEVKYNTLKLGSIKVGDILAKVFTMVRTHHIKIEGDFANVGISIMLLEGIGRRLDPDIDLLQEALPILREAAKHGKGGAYDGKSLRELGSGKAYWMVWAYQKARPVLLLANRIDIQTYEEAMVFFPE